MDAAKIVLVSCKEAILERAAFLASWSELSFVLSLILTTNRKRKYFEKYLAFSQANWAVSAIFFVKFMKNK